MLRNSSLILIEQLNHLSLRKLYCVLFKPNINLGLAVFGHVNLDRIGAIHSFSP